MDGEIIESEEMDVENRITLTFEMEKKGNLKFFFNKKTICITSGVGSGKNHWVENELVKYGKVLLITSRRAKVDETLFKDNEFQSSVMGLKNHAVCTNSMIEKLVRNSATEMVIKNVIEHFDYFVLDEAHSLYSDATFSNAPFYIIEFFREVMKKKKKKIILMTGTAEILDFLDNKKDIQRLDFKKICFEVKPKKYIIISNDTSFNLLKIAAEKKYRIIYFANSAKGIAKVLLPMLIEKCGFDESEIAVVMSDSKAKEHLNAEMQDKMKYVLEYLKAKEKIPNEIKCLITTSKLIEGINIKNKDIKYVICESHFATQIIQIGGRVRKGIDTLYIVNDVKSNYNSLNKLEYNYCEKTEIESANNYLGKLIIENSENKIVDYTKNLYLVKAIKEFIDIIEKKWEYIKFSPFNNNLKMYSLRKRGIEAIENENNKYNACIWEDEDDTLYYARDAFAELLGVEYGVGLISYASLGMKIKSSEYSEEIKKYLIKNNIIDVLLDGDKRVSILMELTKLGIINTRNIAYANLGSLINNSLEYKLIRCGNKNDSISKIVLR
ncbi:MAG: hypothetical protein WCI30_05030 [Clostridia bacterium]